MQGDEHMDNTQKIISSEIQQEAKPAENYVEMSTLTALIAVARSGKKGADLVAKATDEEIAELLHEYSRVRIIY